MKTLHRSRNTTYVNESQIDSSSLQNAVKSSSVINQMLLCNAFFVVLTSLRCENRMILALRRLTFDFVLKDTGPSPSECLFEMV